MDLSVVGKTSGVMNMTITNAPVIANFPIMVNAILTGISDTSPTNSTPRMSEKVHNLESSVCT